LTFLDSFSLEWIQIKFDFNYLHKLSLNSEIALDNQIENEHVINKHNILAILLEM